MPEKRRRSRLKNLIFVAALVLLAFALRLHHLGAPSLWFDELLELDIAQGPLSQVWPQLERNAAMPLDYYLLYGWVRLGRQEAWVRLPALFFGVLTVPLIYVLAARFFTRLVGYLAAVLLTWSPFAIRYSQEVRPYALLLLLVMVGYWGLWQAYKTQKSRYWGLTILGIGGAVLTHYFALFMLLPMGLWVAVQQLRHLREKRFWHQTACFMFGLLILFMILILIGRFTTVYSVGSGFVATASTRPASLTLPASQKPNRGSGPPLESAFFVDGVLKPLASINEPALLVYTVFFLVGLLSLLQRRQKNRATLLLLLAWLLLPILSIYLFLLYRGTFFAVRYILYTLPAYLILVAYGLAIMVPRLGAGLGQQAVLSNLLTGSLPVLVLVPLISAQFDQLKIYYSADSREDWRAVGQLLRDNAQPTDAVIAVRAEPTINWYYPPASVPYGALSHSQPIWEAMAKHQRRWFVLSSYSFRQDKGLRDWLREHGAVTIAIDRRVVVHFHHAGLTHEEMLAEVRTFLLPQKALTYAVLADQFKANGDLETSRILYQKAVDLSQTSLQKADYQARLAALVVP